MGNRQVNSNNMELIENFLIKRNLSKSTSHSYTHTILTFAKFTDKPLSITHNEDAQKYILHLQEANKYKPSTVKRIYHQLLSFFNFLLSYELVETNPFKTVKVPSVPRLINEDRIPTFEEFVKFFEVMKRDFNIRDYLISLFIASTGLRISEILNIKWTDFVVDFNNNFSLKVTSAHDQRLVRILNCVWLVLIRYRDEFLMVDDSYFSKSVFVFTRESDLELYRTNPYAITKPLTIALIRKFMIEACKIADIPLFTAKDLRHAHILFATYFGASDEEVKEQLALSHVNLLEKYENIFARRSLSANEYLEEFFNKIVK